MDNIDLTIDKAFSRNVNLNSRRISIKKEKEFIYIPSVKQSFSVKYNRDFERDTGMAMSKLSELHKEIIEVELGLRCECCGRFINSLNSIYSLCNYCDDVMFNTQNESAAFRNLGFDMLREKRKTNDRRIKNNEERETYIGLFLNSH